MPKRRCSVGSGLWRHSFRAGLGDRELHPSNGTDSCGTDAVNVVLRDLESQFDIVCTELSSSANLYGGSDTFSSKFAIATVYGS